MYIFQDDGLSNVGLKKIIAKNCTFKKYFCKILSWNLFFRSSAELNQNQPKIFIFFSWSYWKILTGPFNSPKMKISPSLLFQYLPESRDELLGLFKTNNSVYLRNFVSEFCRHIYFLSNFYSLWLLCTLCLFNWFCQYQRYQVITVI